MKRYKQNQPLFYVDYDYVGTHFRYQIIKVTFENYAENRNFSYVHCEGSNCNSFVSTCDLFNTIDKAKDRIKSEYDRQIATFQYNINCIEKDKLTL